MSITAEKQITVLECTLRDGSYLIDYQFTAEDTYIICLGLERAGFKWIEIGHGTGLRSSEAGKGKAAASDREYLQAARRALSGTDARFGMFFIPGIGRMEDLEIAAEYGMGFIRVGTNVTEVEQAMPYIEKAKKLGFTVSANLMKSYAVPIEEFIRRAKNADEYGADIICVVDSVGGMFPEDVREYVRRLKDVTNKKIGFHGHNNLQLAVANTLEAIAAGASVVDSSLQGMGRSAGNTQTEILAMVLEKKGYHTGVDSYRTLDLGERVIKPMMNKQQGVDDFSIIGGIARFHSSFSDIVADSAKKHGIDPRRLIVEISDINRVYVTPELAEETAIKIKDRESQRKHFSHLGLDAGFIYKRRSGSPVKQLESTTEEIFSLSRKTGLNSVFSLSLSPTGKTSFPFIRKGSAMIIGNCEAASIDEIVSFLQYLDGRVDWLLLDESCPAIRLSGLDKKVIKSFFAWYSEDRALLLSVLVLLSQKRPQGKALILADPETVRLLTLFLARQGIVACAPESPQITAEFLKSVNSVVAFDRQYAAVLDERCLEYLGEKTALYATKPGAFADAFLQRAATCGLNVYRIDSRVGFAAELNMAVGTSRLIDSAGVTEIDSIPVVSGGMIGVKGSIIVDSRINPATVIGVADGTGGLLAPEEESLYRNEIEHVRVFILENLFSKKY